MNRTALIVLVALSLLACKKKSKTPSQQFAPVETKKSYRFNLVYSEVRYDPDRGDADLRVFINDIEDMDFVPADTLTVKTNDRIRVLITAVESYTYSIKLDGTTVDTHSGIDNSHLTYTVK